jgi:uncharacterized protein Yka (UPF0111/DUF47 family)
MLAAAAIVFFVRKDGGKYLKKAAKKTYEAGEDMDELKEKIIDKEKEVKKKISDFKKNIDDLK